MTISELILMCERRLTHLQSVRGSAVALGDMQQAARIDADLAETQTTLNQLQTLAD
ncbi:MAG: hypothetical protein IOD09_20575 [Rhodocyclaceae bacterium]|nr:hypothetical protein [Rhodocyclaceae bacterium]